jgi:hypothetical protein
MGWIILHFCTVFQESKLTKEDMGKNSRTQRTQKLRRGRKKKKKNTRALIAQLNLDSKLFEGEFFGISFASSA